MVDTLSFSSEVTRVAREVGSEGQLGGQARVEGVYGTWKRLTTNVNELASNLTTQVRAIAEVASAVAQGDMSRSITVETQGEVAELKDNINLMVAGTFCARRPARRTGWSRPRPPRRADAGPPRPDGGRRPDPARAHPAGERAVRRLLAHRRRTRGLHTAVPAKGLAFIAGYGSAQGATVYTVQAGEKKRTPLEEAPPGTLHQDQQRSGRPPASSSTSSSRTSSSAWIELASFSASPTSIWPSSTSS